MGAFVGYKIICTAPCKAALPIGAQALALAYRGSPPLEAEPVLLAEGKSQVRGNYVSRSGTRTAGFVVGGLGMVAGGAVSYIGFSRTKKDCVANLPCMDVPDPNGAVVAGGLGIALASMALSFYLISRRDYVEFSVSPSRYRYPLRSAWIADF